MQARSFFRMPGVDGKSASQMKAAVTNISKGVRSRLKWTSIKGPASLLKDYTGSHGLAEPWAYNLKASLQLPRHLNSDPGKSAELWTNRLPVFTRFVR